MLALESDSWSAQIAKVDRFIHKFLICLKIIFFLRWQILKHVTNSCFINVIADTPYNETQFVTSWMIRVAEPRDRAQVLFSILDADSNGLYEKKEKLEQLKRADTNRKFVGFDLWWAALDQFKCYTQWCSGG